MSVLTRRQSSPIACHFDYAFPTYGPRGMDFARGEAKIILDHFEGIDPDDVTGRFYSADPAINRKCEIIEKRIAWLEHWCAQSAKTVS
jgi:hypothetical protein